MARHDYTAPLTGEHRIVERSDGTLLHTFCAGSGPKTVLLAHGFGCGNPVFEDAFELAEKSLGERRSGRRRRRIHA